MQHWELLATQTPIPAAAVLPMFKFIHAADIHLDSPRQGLDRDTSWDAPVETIRHAPRRALENMVQLALEEEVAFLLIAGVVPIVYPGNLQGRHVRDHQLSAADWAAATTDTRGEPPCDSTENRSL